MAVSKEEVAIVDGVTRGFYEVLPAQLQTYCAATALIAQRALSLLGVASRVEPCQLMYSGAQATYLVGFTGVTRGHGKWDGHAVCATDDWLIDAALHHLNAEFGLSVPRIVSRMRLRLPSHVMCRVDLSTTERLWWHSPPPGFDTTPPAEPGDLVAEMGRRLADHVRQKLDCPVSAI